MKCDGCKNILPELGEPDEILFHAITVWQHRESSTKIRDNNNKETNFYKVGMVLYYCITCGVKHDKRKK